MSRCKTTWIPLGSSEMRPCPETERSLPPPLQPAKGLQHLEAASAHAVPRAGRARGASDEGEAFWLPCFPLKRERPGCCRRHLPGKLPGPLLEGSTLSKSRSAFAPPSCFPSGLTKVLRKHDDPGMDERSRHCNPPPPWDQLEGMLGVAEKVVGLHGVVVAQLLGR